MVRSENAAPSAGSEKSPTWRPATRTVLKSLVVMVSHSGTDHGVYVSYPPIMALAAARVVTWLKFALTSAARVIMNSVDSRLPHDATPRMPLRSAKRRATS